MPPFIGVYRAMYGYTAAGPEELTFAENDLLYLLETAEDGWWTAKKRIAGGATEEPTGIVPKNYIELATPTGQAKALYDYEPQTEEEIAFAVGDNFDVYAEDGDWILVGLKGKFGFSPANYLEMGSAPTPVPKDKTFNPILPPPQHPSLVKPPEPAQPEVSRVEAPAEAPIAATSRIPADEEDEEAPPPKPPRPTSASKVDSEAPRDRDSRRERSDARDVDRRQESGSPRPQFKSWSVQEVDGRHRSRATLSVSEQEILLAPDRGPQQQWDSTDLMSYSSEKKHVFLELQNPRSSLDLKVNSQNIGDQIIYAVAQIAGANRGAGINEVILAAKSAGQKTGKVAANFKAANGRELSVKEGASVFVLSQKDKEWWLVRSQDGREGLVPASYIDVDEDLHKRGLLNRFGRKNNAGKEADRHREQERERVRDERARDERRRKASGQDRPRERDRSSKATGDKRLPDQRKVRTWTDRSGTFRVEAALLGSGEGKIHLHKTNGVKIAVPTSKLSSADLDYVESVTGASLQEDKPLSEVRNERRKAKEASPAPEKRTDATTEFWFQFFLDCGVEPNNAQRYATNFSRDKMDRNLIADITPPVLRNLGLREGDILRVTKKIGEMHGPPAATANDDGWKSRQESGAPVNTVSPGVTGDAATGAVAAQPDLQRSTTAPQPVVQQQPSQPPLQPSLTGPSAQKAASTQPTGALADLLGFSTPSAPQSNTAPSSLQPTGTAQPLQAQKTAEDMLGDQQRQHQRQILRQQAELQQQQIKLLKEQQTELKQQQEVLTRMQTGMQQSLTGNRTGLDPFATGVGGFATGVGGFAPSAAILAAPTPPQPRAVFPTTSFPQAGFSHGALPTQPFQSQTTGPFQNATGSFQPPTSFQSQNTGPFQSQMTGPFQSQQTGPFQSQQTGPFQSQQTGPFQSQQTGPFQSQVTGPFQSQPTGPFQAQVTGPFQSQTAGPFLSQNTGPFQNQTTGSFQAQNNEFQGQNTGAFPAFQASQNEPYHTTFAQAPQPQPNLFQQQTGPFQSQQTGPFLNQTTGPFQSQQTGPFQNQAGYQNAFQSQPSGFQQNVQPSFPATSFQSSASLQSFQTAPTGQSFGAPQPPFGGQPTMGQMMSPSPAQFNQGAPQTSFGQADPFSGLSQAATGTTTGGFTPQSSFGKQLQQQRTGGGSAPSSQPLQSQPTGFGFGNQANLQAASANNPFGFS